MDDTDVLTELNDRFIDAWRKGSWEMLDPILAPTFAHIDGATGTVTDRERYAESLRNGAQPAISIDQVVVHVTGGVAVVSARTSAQLGKRRRYVDTYERTGNGWVCVHACVWPLPDAA